MTDALDEPMEVDSSLQSGGHRRHSPWGVKPPNVERSQLLPLASTEQRPLEEPESLPEAILAEDDADEPAEDEPRAANTTPAKPHKMPSYEDEIDPEFGSFLEGLQ